MAKIYLASSWKNERLVKQTADILRLKGHDVDAFCDTDTGRFVFSFDQLPDVSEKNAITVLEEPLVQKAFHEDKKWLDWADGTLLILPSGKSAHLEAGYTKGQGKFLIIYQENYQQGEFDVMYGFADLVTDDFGKVLQFLNNIGDQKCDYCSEMVHKVRTTPFLADAGAQMCNLCWDMTRGTYIGSEGTDIGLFE